MTNLCCPPEHALTLKPALVETLTRALLHVRTWCMFWGCLKGKDLLFSVVCFQCSEPHLFCHFHGSLWVVWFLFSLNRRPSHLSLDSLNTWRRLFFTSVFNAESASQSAAGCNIFSASVSLAASRTVQTLWAVCAARSRTTSDFFVCFLIPTCRNRIK